MRKHDAYIGRSGQHAVMAEFFRRGYNTAIPEIDMGDDLFVIEDAAGNLSRVQVKSAIAKGKNRAYAIFSLGLKQLRTPRSPDLVYVLAVFHNDLWREFLVIPRGDLDLLHASSDFGRINRKSQRLTFYVSFSDHDVRCGGLSLQRFRNNWKPWPEIKH